MSEENNHIVKKQKTVSISVWTKSFEWKIIGNFWQNEMKWSPTYGSHFEQHYATEEKNAYAPDMVE